MWKSRGAIAMAVLLAGCEQVMAHQPKYRPLAPSDFFADGMSARQPVPGTVPREGLPSSVLADGTSGGKEVDTVPMVVNRALILRGRERFNVYCAPCHDRSGGGNGMIVQRGFPHPPSLHEPRLQSAPIGHFVHVIDQGFGVMYSYATRVPPADRWAIATYIRALQLSQNASLSDAPADEQIKLQEAP